MHTHPPPNKWGEYMKASLKHKDNEMAVSPIVATLVLVVVAVVGAVAVGTIMGTFSSDVSKQANTDGAGTAAQTEILTAGSTTVQPASEEIAKAYMAKNPGVKITVQGGGSGAGVAAVGSGTVDIGATSDIAKVTDKVNDGTFPNLKTYLLGGSAIVVIQNEGTHAMAAAPAAASYQSDLKRIANNLHLFLRNN
jgi:phosphate transport system substrate-binding protein